jgi:hypothetical protein
VELLELGVFGGENLKWSRFLDLELSGALPNTPYSISTLNKKNKKEKQN